MSLFALGLAAPGCTGKVDELARESISGTVKVDGKPLQSGSIVLSPFEEQRTSNTVSSSGPINSGRFSIPRGKGLVPAKYRIAIYGGSAPTPHEELTYSEMDDDDEESATSIKDVIPEKYNANTELSVEIKPGGIKELRIELTSK
jgi:hypothetical protein